MGYGVRNADVSQSLAIKKRRITNMAYRIWYIEALQRTAIIESPPCTVCTLHFLHKRCCILCQTSAKVQKVQGATSAEPYE